jgi:hypothetical protein
MNNIDALKLALVKAREANEKAKETVDKLWRVVEASEAFGQYDQARGNYQNASKDLDLTDKALRDAALAEFKDGVGNISAASNPYISDGVKIKMRHKIKYVLEEVESWARTQAAFLFKFDVKAFEKSPPAGAPFEKYDEPYVELATKNEDFQVKEE